MVGIPEALVFAFKVDDPAAMAAPAGWTYLGALSAASFQSHGLSVAEFVQTDPATQQKTIAIAFGSELNDTVEYKIVSEIIDKAMMQVGATPIIMDDALAYVRKLIADEPNANIFVTGAGMGGTVAEYVMQSLATHDNPPRITGMSFGGSGLKNATAIAGFTSYVLASKANGVIPFHPDMFAISPLVPNHVGETVELYESIQDVVSPVLSAGLKKLIEKLSKKFVPGLVVDKLVDYFVKGSTVNDYGNALLQQRRITTNPLTSTAKISSLFNFDLHSLYPNITGYSQTVDKTGSLTEVQSGTITDQGVTSNITLNNYADGSATIAIAQNNGIATASQSMMFAADGSIRSDKIDFDGITVDVGGDFGYLTTEGGNLGMVLADDDGGIDARVYLDGNSYEFYDQFGNRFATLSADKVGNDSFGVGDDEIDFFDKYGVLQSSTKSVDIGGGITEAVDQAYRLQGNYQFSPIEVPASLHPFVFSPNDPNNGTYVSDINDAGVIVGSYTGTNRLVSLTKITDTTGFIFSGGVYTPLQASLSDLYYTDGTGKKVYYTDAFSPWVRWTGAYGVNNAGTVAGSYEEGLYPSYQSDRHGFYFANGSSTTISVTDPSDAGGRLSLDPAAPRVRFHTQVIDIAGNGTMIGSYTPEGGSPTCFIDRGGSFVDFAYPNAVSTVLIAISEDGTVIGTEKDSSGTQKAFTYKDGTYSLLDDFDTKIYHITGINDSGVIVGYYGNYGFVNDHGKISTITVPGAQTTTIEGINNLGVIVGNFRGSDGVNRGYVATPAGDATSVATSTNLYFSGAGTIDLRNQSQVAGLTLTVTLPGDNCSIHLGSCSGSVAGGYGDEVIFAGSGSNTINGGSGVDTMNYADATSGVNVSLGITKTQTVGGGIGPELLINIENLSGSIYDDTLTGNASDNVLSGGGGNDTLNGGAGTDTVILSGAASDYLVTSSGGTTTIVGSGETDTLTNIEKVTFGDGAGQTLTLAEFQAQAFSPLQALEYIASYKDLMGAFGDDAVWGARHYFNNGKAEGRTISFNALNYLCSYGDLIVAFHDDQLAATEHYLKNGSYEGRKVTFDPLAYVCSYSDLLIAFHDDKAAAAEHYIKNGYWENRKVTFDALAYVCSYDDLVIAFHNDKTAAEEHYIRNGYWEGRKVTFNALAYIASYTDLIGAFGTDVQAAEEHYIRNGFWEGRKVTFDPVAYLINNTDLGTCGFTASDATEHYLKNGYWEHRTTNGAFGSEQTNHDLTVGSLVTDTIGTSGDKDWFAVNVTAGQTYTFTLSGVDGGNGTLADPFLSICDARGVQLTYANDSTNHDAVIRFTALSTGTCYLVASANDTGTGTYKLFATAGG